MREFDRERRCRCISAEQADRAREVADGKAPAPQNTGRLG